MRAGETRPSCICPVAWWGGAEQSGRKPQAMELFRAEHERAAGENLLKFTARSTGGEGKTKCGTELLAPLPVLTFKMV